MKKFLLLAGLLVAGSTLAGEAHVCKSQTVANSAANAELTNDTVFKCGEGISGTIPALASHWLKRLRVLRKTSGSVTVDAGVSFVVITLIQTPL